VLLPRVPLLCAPVRLLLAGLDVPQPFDDLLAALLAKAELEPTVARELPVTPLLELSPPEPRTTVPASPSDAPSPDAAEQPAAATREPTTRTIARLVFMVP
jgi:hypothetical protein